jgi:NAD(P)-dependent dehydrogenase (short-subunit alcohol dehydrogenase family)
MDTGLDGKVVVITGGASGIGRAAVLAFADEGARVTALDRDRAALEALVAERADVATQVVDVAASGAMAEAVDAVVADHGRIDVAVNNAGISRRFGWLHEGSEDDYDAILGINLKGVWLSMRAELAHMARQRSGVIVNTASTVSFAGGPGAAPYTASKHGVVGLTRTAALEYAPLGIRINAVAPGAVDSPMSDAQAVVNADADPFGDAQIRQGHPLGARVQPRQVADAMVFLAGECSGFATGSVLAVDGGFGAQ